MTSSFSQAVGLSLYWLKTDVNAGFAGNITNFFKTAILENTFER